MSEEVHQGTEEADEATVNLRNVGELGEDLERLQNIEEELRLFKLQLLSESSEVRNFDIPSTINKSRGDIVDSDLTKIRSDAVEYILNDNHDFNWRHNNYERNSNNFQVSLNDGSSAVIKVGPYEVEGVVFDHSRFDDVGRHTTPSELQHPRYVKNVLKRAYSDQRTEKLFPKILKDSAEELAEAGADIDPDVLEGVYNLEKLRDEAEKLEESLGATYFRKKGTIGEVFDEIIDIDPEREQVIEGSHSETYGTSNVPFTGEMGPDPDMVYQKALREGDVPR